MSLLKKIAPLVLLTPNPGGEVKCKRLKVFSVMSSQGGSPQRRPDQTACCSRD